MKKAPPRWLRHRAFAFEIIDISPLQRSGIACRRWRQGRRACASPGVCHLRLSMVGRRTSILGFAIVLAMAAYSAAQTTRPDAPLDELDDSAWIQALVESSDASLEEVFSGADLETTLRFLAAVPASDAPETHLVALATLARGDDPNLAPAAAQAAVRIVEGLTHHDLLARESAIDSEATGAFIALAEDPSARRDLQHAGAYIVARLGELERTQVP